MNKFKFTFLVIIFCACSDRNDFLLSEYQKSFSGMIGSKIDIEELNSIQEYNFKVLVLLNTQCASCVLTAKRWSESVNHSIFNNKDIIFLTYGPPNEYFQTNFNESMKSFKDLNHIHYPSEEFIYKNNLELYNLDVFLLNQSDEILLIGDPTKDPLLRKLYKNF
ncbi:hypothetical protein [Roseivirga sp.]|uniref:hypothetical protein n=1 Tax=Roseivirga sp. TaxID=1964215 RepID=UPI003B8D4508